MKPSEALEAIAAALIASDDIRKHALGEIHIDYPGDPERDQEYKPNNSQAFLYFGPATYQPVANCGDLLCRVRIYAVSFAPDRCEAHDLIRYAISALDHRFGAALEDPFVSFVAGGDVIEPFSPKSAYADFQFMI